MAAGPLLVSEPLQRYRALGLAGDPVWRAAGQLRTAIAQRLSRRHADLLAIPEVDPTGRRIDWYAPFEGHARTAPGEDTLYVVDGKPVMTFWGFSADANLPGVFLASPPVMARAAVRPQ